MNKLLISLWLPGLLAAGSYRAAAQVLPTDANGRTVNPAAPMVRPDTATVRKPSARQKRELAAADSARRTEKLFGLRLTKPAKAGFLAIVPGGGQIYNRKYWKLPIVYGLVGGLGYWVYYQQRYYGYFKFANGLRPIQVSATQTTSVVDQILAASDQIPNDELRASIATNTANNATYISNGLIFYRRYRDLSILLSGLGYSLTILDAVVDAHLSEFDVSDDLSLRWQPAAVPVPGQAASFAPGVVLTLSARR